MAPDPDKQKGALARASAIGLEMAGAVIGCLIAGYYADAKLGTSPWLTLIGITVGSIAGFWALLKTAKAANEADRDEDDPR